MPKTTARTNLIYVGTLPPHPGGSATSCVQISQGLVQRGFNIRAIAPITPTADQAEKLGFPTSRFIIPNFDTTPHLPPTPEFLRIQKEGITRKLLPLIYADKPDVIIVGRESFAWHVPDIARAYGIPTLLCIRGNPTHGLIDGTYPKDAAAKLIEHFRKTNAIVANAKHMAKGLQGLGFRNVQTIPNFVNLAKFKPHPKDTRLLDKLNIETEDVVAILVSNLKEKKRPMDIVHSAQQALKNNPNLLYIIVGEGNQKQALIKTCKKMDIYDRFRFTGWIDYTQMPAYINLADIMLMPSQAEAIARVYLEAMACGCPIIASNISGAQEVISDSATGFLYPVGDINELTRHTLFLAQHADIRTAFGQRAHQKSQVYGYQNVVDRYADLLRKLKRSKKKDHTSTLRISPTPTTRIHSYSAPTVPKAEPTKHLNSVTITK